jgi:hypothetical protein
VSWLGEAWGNSVISEEHLTSPVYNRTNDLYSNSLDFLNRSFDVVALGLEAPRLWEGDLGCWL